MVTIFVETKEHICIAYTAAQKAAELDIQNSCAIDMQQPQYHNMCRTCQAWQHAGL